MNKKQIIKLITFPIVLGGCIASLDIFLFRKVSDDLTSYGQFYKEQKNALDVVLIGNSTLREGYIPTKMWDEYQITSRSFSSSPTHPSVIKEAISDIVIEQKPKVIFIDLNGLTFQKRENADFFIKQYYKALPEGEHKKDLETKYDYLVDDSGFEIFDNHNNFRQQQYWESLVYPDQFKTKGYQPNKKIKAIDVVELDDSTILPLNEDGSYYFEEIISECKKYQDQVEFIFGKMPKYNDVSGAGAFKESEYMFRTIEKALKGTSFKYANFTKEIDKIGLNPKTDFKDNDHLNHLGALKFTSYFGKYLSNQIHLEKKTRDETVINNFNEASRSTKEYLDDIESKLLKKIK